MCTLNMGSVCITPKCTPDLSSQAQSYPTRFSQHQDKPCHNNGILEAEDKQLELRYKRKSLEFSDTRCGSSNTLVNRKYILIFKGYCQGKEVDSVSDHIRDGDGNLS